MDTELVFGGRIYRVALGETGGTTSLVLDDRQIEGEISHLTPNVISLTIGGRRYTAYVARSEEKVFVQVDGRLFELAEADAEERASAVAGGAVGGNSVSSPMPGRVVKIPVSEGDSVDKNQTLVIVEAMKMENPLRSPIAGKVKRVHYGEGDLVDAGRPIVEVEPLEE